MTDSLIQEALRLKPRELRALVPALHLMIASAEVRPSQRFFLAELVDGSFARGRSALRVLTLCQVMHLRGMGDAQVSQLLNGYAGEDSLRVRGLIELGMVRRRQLPDARGKAGGWLVELVADWSQWRCGFKYTHPARLNHLALLDALWAEHEAQSVAGEIVERFCLPAMLAATEIKNALRLATALRHQMVSGLNAKMENDVERGSHANGDAACVPARPSQDAHDQTVSGLKCERERNAPGDALRPCRSHAQDARRVPRTRDAGAVPCVSAGAPLRFVKAEVAGTEAGFTNRKPSRARLLNREQEQKTVQQLNSAMRADDSNRLLAMLRVEFDRVHGPAWTEKEMINSGAAWRMVARHWPDEFEIQVGEMRNFITGGGKVKCAWAYFQSYFKRAVGCDTWLAVCEKSKESFSNH